MFHGRKIASRKVTLPLRHHTSNTPPLDCTADPTLPGCPRPWSTPRPSWLADGDPPFDASNYGGGWRPARAIDGDTKTGWTTHSVGTGIVVDTGEAQPYGRIGIATSTPGFAATVYSSSDNKGPGDPASNGWKRVGSASKVAKYQTIRIPPANVRYLLIYVTKLPSGQSKASINEVRLLLD
jgi:hypothetical protein